VFGYTPFVVGFADTIRLALAYDFVNLFYATTFYADFLDIEFNVSYDSE
jgi:hypothetical protein